MYIHTWGTEPRDEGQVASFRDSYKGQTLWGQADLDPSLPLLVSVRRGINDLALLSSIVNEDKYQTHLTQLFYRLKIVTVKGPA